MSWDGYVKSGTLAAEKRQFVRAQLQLKQAIEFAQKNFQADDYRLASALSFLGQIYFAVGDFDKAAFLLDQSLFTNLTRHPWNEPCIFMDLFALAEMKKYKGEMLEAARMGEAAARS